MSQEVNEMFDNISKRYDLANTILSGGTHHLWRSNLVKAAKLKGEEKILDVATGTGDLAFAFEQKLKPEGSIIAVDFVESMVELAKQKASTKENSNIQFSVADAMALPFSDEQFDLVSISFGIRNVDDPLTALKEFHRVTKPSGKVLVLEFGQPTLPGFSHAYNAYSKYLMPIIGGSITGNKAAYQYLPETSKNFPCRDEFCDLLKSAGYKNASWNSQMAGIAFIYEATK